jgi:hypothetical protein
MAIHISCALTEINAKIKKLDGMGFMTGNGMRGSRSLLFSGENYLETARAEGTGYPSSLNFVTAKERTAVLVCGPPGASCVLLVNNPYCQPLS